MKKTLIALAAVAVSGAAMAQSSVNLYGIADVYVGKAKGSSAAMGSGGVSTSRWGIKGSEDLGGGLAANFNFEQGLNLTDGTTGSGFNRQARVGLSGGFGEVQMGKLWSAFDDIAGATSPLFDSTWTTNNIAPTYTGYAASLNSGVKYISPEFAGVTAAISSQFKQGADNDRATAFNVAYTGGPVYVALGYEQQKNDAGVDNKLTRVVGSYDFGAAKLLASYGKFKDYADDLTIGVDVPLGSALTLSAGYTTVDFDAGGKKPNNFGLALAYGLSKRTTVYTGFNKLNDAAVDAGMGAENAFAVGIKHTF